MRIGTECKKEILFANRDSRTDEKMFEEKESGLR
jgi:hypothetical protein